MSGRGGDSLDALRAIWMEGYNRARKDLGLPPFVEISRADLEATLEPGHCANPDVCPVCIRAQRSPEEGK